MKYIFKTNATMKEYNNQKWWIDSNIVREIDRDEEEVKKRAYVYVDEDKIIIE